MELTKRENPATVTMAGDGSIQLSAGQSLKIESSPAGEELLNTDPVPEGKVYNLSVSVRGYESDAE